MSVFDNFVKAARGAFAGSDLSVTVDRPKSPDGLWFLTLVRDDGFMIEVEWHRHRGFGIAAGRDLAFGSGVDEIYGSADAALERIAALVETGETTSAARPVDLADLRKLRGFFQKEIADRLGITKSGLAQMERTTSVTSMQIDTLRKLIASMGGELVLTAHFPEGGERRIAVD